MAPRYNWQTGQYDDPNAANSTSAAAQSSLSTPSTTGSGSTGAGALSTTPVTGQPVNPNNMGINQAVSPSGGQWYSGLNNDPLTYEAANDPYLGGNLYAQETLGLPGISHTGSWLGTTFNPGALGIAEGKGALGPEEQLAQQTQLYNTFNQPGTQFFDPRQVVANTLRQLAGVDFNDPNLQYNPLAMIVNPSMSPQQQVESIASFLKAALQGVMGEDQLKMYTDWITMIGTNLVMQGAHQSSADFEKGGNIAQRLMQVIGSSGGL